jgi:ACS family glucarate transporter-like MFS transporter
MIGEPAEARATWVRYDVLAWLCMATTIAYVDRGCLSVAEKSIRTDLGLSPTVMGFVMSAFFATYALFQVPGAWLDQRWGSRRAIPFFSAVWSVATALCGAASGAGMLLIGRLAMGSAEAGLFPAAIGVLGRWFPVTRRAWVSGVLGSFMGVGGAVGAAASGMILANVSWRWMFLIYAVPGMLWAIGFYAWFRNSPAEHPAVNEAELSLIAKPAAPKAHEAEPGVSWYALLGDRAVLGLSAQQFFRAAATIFYLTWFPTYLRDTFGVSLLQAGVLSSLPHWADVAGALVGGWLSDAVRARTGSLRLARQGVGAASMAGVIIAIGLAMTVSDPWLAVFIMSVGKFVAALAGPAAYAMTMDLGGRNTPQVFGIMNAAGSVGSVIFPVIAPRLVKATGSWDATLGLVAAIYLAAGVCWLTFDADRRAR